MNIHKNARLTPLRREEMAVGVISGRLSRAQAVRVYMERVFGLLDPQKGSVMQQVHILENYPLVAGIVASTDAIGIVSADYAETRTFRKHFAILPFELGEPMPLAAASRARWTPTRPMQHFMTALRNHPLTGRDPM